MSAEFHSGNKSDFFLTIQPWGSQMVLKKKKKKDKNVLV